VQQFRASILAGDGVTHAQAIVPDAFATAVTERLALDRYAAAIALMARLSDESPAGCVAEEILAVELIGEATDRIETLAEAGSLSREEGAAAIEALRSLFDLFEDDDVLAMFEMAEPADAALAGQSRHNILLGVADQPVEGWFRPFITAARRGTSTSHRADHGARGELVAAAPARPEGRRSPEHPIRAHQCRRYAAEPLSPPSKAGGQPSRRGVSSGGRTWFGRQHHTRLPVHNSRGRHPNRLDLGLPSSATDAPGRVRRRGPEMAPSGPEIAFSGISERSKSLICRDFSNEMTPRNAIIIRVFGWGSS
jgi:hypothetical protein